MKISVTKYNEVNPSELGRLFSMGARLIKSEYANGYFIGKYIEDGKKEVFAYSDDNILIKNVTLPLSINGTYDREIEIMECV